MPCNSGSDSWTPSCVDLPEGTSKCDLYVVNPSHLKVAKGTVYNNPTVTLDNCTLPSNHVKVSIDKVLAGHAPLSMTIEKLNLLIVNDELGAFIAWPKSLVFVPTMAPSYKGKD